jgi:hypothetical protein
MNSRPTKLTLLALLSLGAAGFITGCGTPGNYQNADKTGSRIGRFRDDVVAIQKAVGGTEAALDSVVQQATTNPRKAFEKFAKALDQVDAANERSKKCADQMRAEGKAFFEQWQQDIATVQNPAVRNLAEQRKVKLEQTFRNISRVTVQSKDDFRSWFNDVRDLQKYLGNDLTVAGIDSARDLIAKARADAVRVTQSLDTLVAELNSVEAAITPARAPKDK